MNGQSIYLGDVLSGSWELTQRIFKNLSFREVVRCRAVCKLWADVGGQILDKRRKFHYLTVHPNFVPTTEGKVIRISKSPSALFEEFFEHIVSKPRYCIGFCNKDWLSRVDVFSRENAKEHITLAKYVSKSLPSSCEFGLVSTTGIIGTVEQNYQGHWLKSANILNQKMLSLLCSKENESQKQSKQQRRSSNQGSSENDSERDVNSANAVSAEGGPVMPSSSYVPESTKNNNKKSSVSYSIEVESLWESSVRPPEAVTLLLIPHHPGVKLKYFQVDRESYCKDFCQGELDFGDIVISPEVFNKYTSLTPEEDLKAMLIFDTGLHGLTTALLHAALSRQTQKVAIGGGFIQKFDCGKKDKHKGSFGIAISGPNVMAASVIIPKHVTNPKALDKYIKMLKSCGLPEDQSLAFMFTCCGRGYTWYKRRGNPRVDYSNVESKAFRKVFPNTPLFGMFGEGEIGISYLPKFNDLEDDTDESPPKKRKNKMVHQFTTVIVLLSFL